jgi:selenocysteine lyase/cysteine desulfurase
MVSLSDVPHLYDPAPGYLNTAGNGVPPRAAVEAFRVAITDWSRGRTPQADERHFAAVDRGRAAFAQLTGVTVDQVTIGGSVSALAGLVAAALPDFSEVLTADGDFTAVVFPFAAQAARGVTVRSVPLCELAGAVTEATTLVAYSEVQSADGAVARNPAIAAAARAHGAAVMIDATQSCGWFGSDGVAADFIVCGAYKYLTSPNGVALMTVAGNWLDRITPHAAGWYAGEDIPGSFYGLPMTLAGTARRLDASPAWMCWAAAAEAIELLAAIGAPAIRAHNVAVANRLRRGLGMPPGDSAIVSADLDEAARARLAAAGVATAFRAGRVRMSCHLYTTDADIDLALNAIHG